MLDVSRSSVCNHPVEVAAYAARHDYSELLDFAGPLIIGMPKATFKETGLPSQLLRPWVPYHESWCRVLRAASECNPAAHSNAPGDMWGRAQREEVRCGEWPLLCAKILHNIACGGVRSLLKLDNAFAIEIPYGLDCCAHELKRWRSRVDKEVASIPKFSTFL